MYLVQSFNLYQKKNDGFKKADTTYDEKFCPIGATKIGLHQNILNSVGVKYSLMYPLTNIYILNKLKLP